MSEREYPVPGFPEYFVTYDGQVISYRKNKGVYASDKQPVVRKILKGATQSFGVKGQRVEQRFNLKRDPELGPPVYKRHGPLVAAAKYGRWPEPHEEVRHLDGDYRNNSFDNVEIGDRINNAIDDFTFGRRTTTVEQIDLAIDRLMMLREKIEQEKSPSK